MNSQPDGSTDDKASLSQRQTGGAAAISLAVWQHRGSLMIVLDALTVVGSFMLAYYLRFYVEFLAIKRVSIGDFILYAKGAVLLAAIWVYLIWREGGYGTGLQSLDVPIERIRSLIMSALYALTVLMVISFLYRELLLSRQVYLMTGVIACTVMMAIRFLFRALELSLARRGIVAKRAVIVGVNDQALEFVERLGSAAIALSVAGFLTWNGDDVIVPDRFSNLPVLGRFKDFRSLYERHRFDIVLLTSPAREGGKETLNKSEITEVVNFCEGKSIPLYMLPGSFDIAVARHEAGSLAGVALIRLQDALLHPVYALVKRITDICISVAVLILASLLYPAIALVIKMTSRGPVFFFQTRAGLHGKPFTIYKFRTMVLDAEKRLETILDIDGLEVPGFKIKNDPRVTPFGRFLRRTSLDEIPQFINVLKGDMSIVGPRPELPELVARYTPEQKRRLKAKPGITGYQQVMVRGIPLAQGIKYDLMYLKHQSLTLDVYIILKTILVVLLGKGVTH